MQETHPLRVFPDGGDEHVTSNLKVDGSSRPGSRCNKPWSLIVCEGQGLLNIMPVWVRLEPELSTLRLEVTCSIQLSYGAKLV